jgi:hypothetical protein
MQSGRAGRLLRIKTQTSIFQKQLKKPTSSTAISFRLFALYEALAISALALDRVQLQDSLRFLRCVVAFHAPRKSKINAKKQNAKHEGAAPPSPFPAPWGHYLRFLRAAILPHGKPPGNLLEPATVQDSDASMMEVGGEDDAAEVDNNEESWGRGGGR